VPDPHRCVAAVRIPPAMPRIPFPRGHGTAVGSGMAPQAQHDTAVDVLICGGGLQACLLVLALRQLQPQLRVGVLESGPALAGNHTWCLHNSDVPASVWQWLQPAIVHQWPGYQVAFPGLQRRVALPYAAISSDHMAALVQEALAQNGGQFWPGQTVVSCTAQSAVLADGTVVTAKHVVDARGLASAIQPGRGYQKFVGHEVELTAPHGLAEPLLMDAKVPQLDGLRFLYVLPLSPTRLLVEDTCFSDSPQLDRAGMELAIAHYCHTHGWRVADTIRTESGVLPMPWAPASLPDSDVLIGGMRGGWFHPLTGYSLPEAARLADQLARLPLHDWQPQVWQAWHTQLAGRSKLARLLCFALFRLAEPASRIAMLERFYRRDDAVVGRFYALRSTSVDVWRIFAGVPPRGMRWWPRPNVPSPLSALLEVET
jgi:lycopene beta-cyclase